jgi:thymidine kinase
VAEFVFFTGPMDCGKSTLALQLDYTHRASGRAGRLFTSQDRAGEATISSRLGLERPAVEVAEEFDFWAFVVGELTGGPPLDYLICDETQFYTADQVDQLAAVVDELDIDVFAFGILSDFRSRLFPGSQRLVELADRIEILQVRALCWCGRRATHNARTVDGVMVVEGDQVVVGDTHPAADSFWVDDRPAVIAYEVLCRLHHRHRMTRLSAQAARAEPLPFERGDDPFG